jgi:integrase
MATITTLNLPDGEKRYKARIRRKGNPRQRSKTFRTRKAAERWAHKMEGAMETGAAGLDNESQRKTLSAAIARYRRDILPKRSDSTRPNYERHLTYWDETLGHHKLANLTSAVLARARDDLAAKPISPKREGGEPKPRSPATVRRYLATLEAVLTACVRSWHWLSVSPLKSVQKPEGADRKRTRFLSREELSRLLDACRESESPDLYLAVLLAVTTGARRSELMGLRWRDIDLERCVLRVRAETANSVKGDVRSLPIPAQAVALLNARQAEQRQKEKIIDLKSDRSTALVFPSRVTKKAPVDLRKPFETALKRARIEGFRWHDLRHSAASFMAANGASLLEIGAILGHKQAQTTSRYSHLTEQASHARVLSTADDILAGCTKQ